MDVPTDAATAPPCGAMDAPPIGMHAEPSMSDLTRQLEGIAAGQQVLIQGLQRLEAALSTHQTAALVGHCETTESRGSQLRPVSAMMSRRSDGFSILSRNTEVRDEPAVAPKDTRCSQVSDNSYDGSTRKWAAQLQLRSELVEHRDTTRHDAKGSRTHEERAAALSMWRTTSLGKDIQPAPPPWVLNPASRMRVIFDVITLAALLCDLVIVPLLFAWDLPLAGMWRKASLGTTVVWTGDMLVSFFTGFYTDLGMVEMMPRMIAARYLQKRFWFDLLLVCTAWMSYVSSSTKLFPAREPLFEQATRLLKLFGILRLASVSRLMKAARGHLEQMPPNIRRLGNMVELVFAITYLNHVLACGWYWLGVQASSDTGHRWVETFVEKSDLHYGEATLSFQYFTSLHWSLTQMTPGSMQVFPYNTAERIYNVVCLLFGFVFFGSLISMLSAETTQMRMMRSEQLTKMNQLQKYLREKNVSHEVVLQIKQEVYDRMRIRKPLHADDITLLQSLSARMRTALHCDACKPFLLRHPLMRCMLAAYPSVMRTMCSGMALKFRVIIPGNTLFEANSRAECAYVIAGGSIGYLSAMGNEDDEVPTENTLGWGHWLAEAALWLRWTHMGVAEALTMSEVLAINAKDVLCSFNDMPPLRRVLRLFGRFYRKFLDECSPEDVAGFDDTSTASFDRAEQLLGHLPKQLRVMLGHTCVEALNENWSWVLKRRQLQELAAEVDAGKCTLFFNEAGEVQRLLQLVAIRLTLDDGHVLVQVGTWQDGVLETDCKLPATKLLEEEEPHAAAERLLRSQLGALAAGVRWSTMELQTETTWSKSYDVKTKYFKNIQRATYSGDFSMPVRTKTRPSVAHVARNFSMSSTTRARRLQMSDDIIVLSDGKKALLFAWMTPEQFSDLEGGESKAELLTWMQALHTPDELAQRAKRALQEWATTAQEQLISSVNV
mmetsp:Transcript_46211/g.134554  ORF Transcript_46211/g.134554 Transcript_46211/m.134554 type:complete len:947 (-) Transcript_46211:260-3100(-)